MVGDELKFGYSEMEVAAYKNAKKLRAHNSDADVPSGEIETAEEAWEDKNSDTALKAKLSEHREHGRMLLAYVEGGHVDCANISMSQTAMVLTSAVVTDLMQITRAAGGCLESKSVARKELTSSVLGHLQKQCPTVWDEVLDTLETTREATKRGAM